MYAHLVLISILFSSLAVISFLVKNTVWLVVGTSVHYFCCYNDWPEEWRQKSDYRFAKSLLIPCFLRNALGLIRMFLIAMSKSNRVLLKASEMSGIVGSRKTTPVSHQSLALQCLFICESTKRLPRADAYLVPNYYLLFNAKFTHMFLRSWP